MRTYEHVRFDWDGFKGSTFGCGCCSFTDELKNSDVAKEMLEISEMYQKLSDRYKLQAYVVDTYGAGVVVLSLQKIHHFRKLEKEINDYMDGKEYTTQFDIHQLMRIYIATARSWDNIDEAVSDAWPDWIY